MVVDEEGPAVGGAGGTVGDFDGVGALQILRKDLSLARVRIG